jgi:hypothetical protein
MVLSPHSLALALFKRLTDSVTEATCLIIPLYPNQKANTVLTTTVIQVSGMFIFAGSVYFLALKINQQTINTQPVPSPSHLTFPFCGIDFSSSCYVLDGK